MVSLSGSCHNSSIYVAYTLTKVSFRWISTCLNLMHNTLFQITTTTTVFQEHVTNL